MGIQLGGIGRLLMQFLKSVLQSMQIYDILTCADNAAVPFFVRQGFNDKEILMDPKRWVRRIKDYSKVTLVHCHIEPQINYMRTVLDFELIEKFIEDRIGKRCHKALFASKDVWKSFKYAPTILNVPLKKVMKLTDGGARRGPAEELALTNYRQRMASLREAIIRLVDDLKEADPDELFHRPVTEEIAEGYFDEPKNPMDFWTMEKRLARFPDYYKTPQMLEGNMELMFENCAKYNHSDPRILAIQKTVHTAFTKLYRNLAATYGHVP
jgi:histone acetyltransferase